MEPFLFTLFGNVILFYLTIAALIVIFFIADITETGYSAFLAFAAFIGLNYFWGTLPIVEIFSWTNIALYLLIGFLFSLIRTYFKGRSLDEKEKLYFDLKYAVFRWWFLWPVSMIIWLVGDLLIDVYKTIYSKISNIYEYLFGMPKKQ